MSWLKSWKEGQHLHVEVTVGANTVKQSYYHSTPRTTWIMPAIDAYLALKERQDALDAVTKRLKEK